MDKDKNFITAIILTILIIFFYPIIMKKMFPEHFQPVENTQSIQSTPEKLESGEVEKLLSNDVKSLPEKTYILKSDLYNVIINSPAGEIKRIEFAKIKDPSNGAPTVLIDTQDNSAGIFNTKELLKNAQLIDVKEDINKVTFKYKNNDGLVILKTIYVDNDLYKIGLNIDMENLAVSMQDVSYQVVTVAGLPEVEGIAARFRNIVTLYNNKTFKKSPNSIKEKKVLQGDIKISGIVSRYFSLIISPLTGADYFYTYNLSAENNICGIGKNSFNIDPGQRLSHKYVLYAGTNSYEQMAALNLEIEQARGKGFWAGLSDLLLLLLRWLYQIFKNYGVAVIALALTINIFLYPLTFKSLKSMKEMQALQPMVEKIRNDHKDNPDKLNREVMELYKKHKVNPAGGCLPMLLQMPVFFSLYGVLMQAIELRGAGFLWIKDLSAPDAFIAFSNELPFLGSSLNLLPIIMVVLSFAQQKMTSTGPANDQQKAMVIMMPIFLGFIFYGFPSGLVLYFLTNSIFSFIVQMRLSKKFEVQAA